MVLFKKGEIMKSFNEWLTESNYAASGWDSAGRYARATGFYSTVLKMARSDIEKAVRFCVSSKQEISEIPENDMEKRLEWTTDSLNYLSRMLEDAIKQIDNKMEWAKTRYDFDLVKHERS
jgi:hypothetical protein